MKKHAASWYADGIFKTGQKAYYTVVGHVGMERRRFLAMAGATVMSMSIAGCGTESSSDTSGGDANDDGGNDNGDDSSGNSTTDGGDSGGDGGGGLEILEDEYYEEDISAGVRGTVVNNSDSEVSYVGVQAEFLDSEGTRVGEGLDNTTDLAGGQEWDFDTVALDADAEEIDSYNIEVSDSSF